MPVPFARLEPDNVAGADLLDGAAVPLHASTTGGDYQRLPEWMCVPGRAGTRFEGHDRAADARRRRSLKPRVDPHRTREPVRRSLGRWLRAALCNLHSLFSTSLVYY